MFNNYAILVYKVIFIVYKVVFGLSYIIYIYIIYIYIYIIYILYVYTTLFACHYCLIFKVLGNCQGIYT